MLKKRKRPTRPHATLTSVQVALYLKAWMKLADISLRNDPRGVAEAMRHLAARIDSAVDERFAKVPSSRAARRSSSGVKRTSRTTRRV